MILKKLLCVFIILLLINIFVLQESFAISSIIDDANDFLNETEESELPIGVGRLKATNSKIYNILLACGIGVAVVIGAILGITFILSSVEGKAKIQEALIPYVVGCVVVFGAFTIWKIAINTGNSIESEISRESGNPNGISLTWDKAASAKEYIDNGGDLGEVPNDKLLEWYGQLSRLSGNSGIYTEYYEKVKTEIDNRGGYETLSEKVHGF